MVTKLSPREKAALATQMMNKAVAPSPAPTSTTEAPFRQINSVQIGLAMAGQGGRVAELERTWLQLMQSGRVCCHPKGLIPNQLGRASGPTAMTRALRGQSSRH